MHVMLLTADPHFEHAVRASLAAPAQVELSVLAGPLAANEEKINARDLTLIVLDLDAAREEEMAALARLMMRLHGWPPVVVVTQRFDQDVARRLLQLRVADFLVKPVQPAELMRTCTRVVQAATPTESNEAEIFTYLSAGGGAGVTTLAIQTALALLNRGQKTRPPTCLVDLDFQHGTCADYLDLEPRLDLKEIEPHPERLDRQLLEVMTSYHPSGLAVIAAPHRPAEMRNFDPDLVTRLLDLVAAHFTYVVIDMPRTWFAWTDSVLLGSNRVFIVSEMTVPGLKRARELVAAIAERLGEDKRPKVIINRFEHRLFGVGLRRRDVEQTLGRDFLAAIPNDYALVREAIDRGVPLEEVKPGNKIAAQIKRLIAQAPAGNGTAEPRVSASKRGLSLLWGRT